MHKWILALATGVLIGGCLMGCGAIEKRTHEQQLETVEAYMTQIKDLGVNVKGFAYVPLRAGLQTRTEFGSDGHIVIFWDWEPEPGE